MLKSAGVAVLMLGLIGASPRSAGGGQELPTEREQAVKSANKRITKQLQNISALEKKLTAARAALADELRRAPGGLSVPALPDEGPAIVTFISGGLGINHGSEANIHLGDRVLVVRRNGNSLVIGGDGKVIDVTKQWSYISILHNIAGMSPEDEVYLLNNPASPYTIANIQVESKGPTAKP